MFCGQCEEEKNGNDTRKKKEAHDMAFLSYASGAALGSHIYRDAWCDWLVPLWYVDVICADGAVRMNDMKKEEKKTATPIAVKGWKTSPLPPSL